MLKSISVLSVVLTHQHVIGFVPTDCYQPCTGGNCRYDDCKETITCPGGLCYFYDCMHPSCDGGACTFERCWMPSCKGGACTNINPMEVEETKTEYVAFPVLNQGTNTLDPPSNLRGSGAVAIPQIARFEDGRLPPPPPPNRIESNQMGDPEEEARLDMQARVEAKLLADLKIKEEAGVIKNEEKIQLKYLETRAESEAKKLEWERHQREVEIAYEEAKRAQAVLEEEARKAEQKRLEEEAKAFAIAEQARIEAEEKEAQLKQQQEIARREAEAAEEALRYEKLLKENAAAQEEERVKQEESIRFAQVQQRMQAKLENKEQPVPVLSQVEQPVVSRLTGLSVPLSIPLMPKLDFKPMNEFLDKQPSNVMKQVGDQGGGETHLHVFTVINKDGVCVMPMVSFEVAVFALSVFLSSSDMGSSESVADFLKLTETFFGLFIALIGVVSITTPGGELVMLCCVSDINDIILRTWFLLFLLVLCMRAVFEMHSDRHERWLRLLQVACVLFVADCFVIHQLVCHQVPSTDPEDRWRASAMYIWASCIFYLVFRIESYLDASPNPSRFESFRKIGRSEDTGFYAGNSRYRFPSSDGSVDICDVDDEDEEFGYKAKNK